MGALNKLMFWKKDDDFDFDSALDKEMAPSGLPPTDNLGLDEKSPFDHPAQPTATTPYMSPQQATNPYDQQQVFPTPGQSLQRPTFQQSPQKNNDLDLISSKLDTIKAQLSSIEQRLVNLERAAGVEQQKRLW